MATQVKTIGQSGQLSLGKEYAGRTVIIDNPEEGVWVIKTAKVIPDNEMWLHQTKAKEKLESGLAWAESTDTAITDLDAFEASVKAKWEAKHKTSLDE